MLSTVIVHYWRAEHQGWTALRRDLGSVGAEEDPCERSVGLVVSEVEELQTGVAHLDCQRLLSTVMSSYGLLLDLKANTHTTH